jgi:putative transposase
MTVRRIDASSPMDDHKRLVRYHEPGHLHELTFSCYRQLPLLDSEAAKVRLARCIDAAGDETGIELVAFVFMPEHVHLLTYAHDRNPDIRLYLARIKQPFSKQMKDAISESDPTLAARLTVQERPGKSCFRFWQAGGGYDRNLFSPQAIAAALNYLHANPVKRGLCERAIDWKWSSAKLYICDSPTLDPNLPRVAPLPMGSLH